MVRPSSRGGVPVLSRPCGSFSSFSRADSDPRGRIARAAAGMAVEADVDRPVQESAGRQDHAARIEANAHLRDDAANAVALHHEVVARAPGTATGSAGSPGAGGSPPCRAPGRPARASPARPAPSSRSGSGSGCPASSAAAAIAPPSASISLTRWPLPMPPIDGLQLICPSVSIECVSSRVDAPMRADGERGLGAGVAAADDDDVEMSRKLHAGPAREGRLYFSRAQSPRRAAERPGVAAGRSISVWSMPSSRKRALATTKPKRRVERLEPRLRRDADRRPGPELGGMGERARHRLAPEAAAPRRPRS